ncbi:NAD(P)-binding domain-containing protein [Lactobacillus rhamnosus]|uniref:NAD(P)-binding domain-containing protein n=1 Tax=Lacticaseibacillus rhamnosus TaxID=47715 RepID=A0A7Y7QI32_LACRH|nr:NAD(P)-binding domain-containing protein [Lacticaseibacillus rhamnosus]NVO89541.1 NAD(P)-binding domain-containing protein [Lacticaseibacillus rhamnosus]
MKTQLFDFEQLQQLPLTEHEKINWVDQALRLQDQVELPAKISLKPSQETFYNFMPVVIPAMNIAGVKVIDRIPGHQPALTSHILLYNLASGELKAVLDGTYITAIRTGAVAVHSIQLLAKSQFNRVGFIGLGNQARATAKTLLATHQGEPLQVVLLRYKDQAAAFKRYLLSLQSPHLVDVKVVARPEAVFAESDVVVSSVTYAEKDLLSDPNVMRPGTLLVPIHTRGFMNLDPLVDRVYCDAIAQIRNFKYFNRFKAVAQMDAVVKGEVPGRQNDQERLTVYNIGTALQDLFFAERLYEMANAHGQASFDWHEPQRKAWYQ